jgi:hypothetical protein
VSASPGRVPQTADELAVHVREHVDFLRTSGRAFDLGSRAEAKRVATSVRVLVHDTGRSRSALRQLGLKSTMTFWCSASPISGYGGQHPLVALYRSATGSAFAPLLDEPVRHRRVPFDEWWGAPVLVDQERRSYSRRALVLWMANQDGGAHVDPALDPVYASITRSNALGWCARVGHTLGPLRGAPEATVRQIGHELVRSLEDDEPHQRFPFPPGVDVVASLGLELEEDGVRVVTPLVPQEPLPPGGTRRA